MDFIDIIKQDYLEQLVFHQWDHPLTDDKATRAFIADQADAELETMSNKLGGGIYRMYDADGDIIYVGKSNDIHRRLLQHIGHRSNTYYFIDEVVKIEFHVNDDPVMQTMLEGIFIAYHEPAYNDEIQDRIRKQHGNQ